MRVLPRTSHSTVLVPPRLPTTPFNAREKPMKTTNNEGAVGSAVDRLATGAHHAVDKIADATHSAAETLANKGHQAAELQEKWLQNLRGYVHDKPVQSIGIAVATGYLLSRIFSSR